MKKILVQGFYGSHTFGFQPLFMSMGWQWIWWEEVFASPFKVFDEVQPDLFFGVGEPSRALKKCLEEFQTPTIFQVAPFTYKINGRILKKYHTLFDNTSYNIDRGSGKLNCDIGCFTINKQPNPYITSLCHPVGQYNIKILGPHSWELPQYLGNCSIEEKVDLYRSTKLIFCETEEEKARAIACGSVGIGQEEISLGEYGEFIGNLLGGKIKLNQKKWFGEVKTYQEILPEIMDELNV